MTPEELNKPRVPIAYLHLNLQLAEEHGVDRDRLLDGLDIAPQILDQPDAFIGLIDYGRVCLRCMDYANEPAMGYEFGLRNNMTLHGFYGFGVMSQPSIREAITFAIRFAPLRMPGWSMLLDTEDEFAVVHCHENVPFGMLRQYAQEMMVIGLLNSFQQFLPNREAIELLFDCPEPAYHARYAERLPTCHFNAGRLAVRFPRAYLELPMVTANLVTARLVARECEREMALLGRTQSLVEQVRAEIRLTHDGYPDLEAVARRLYMSSRTLKRHLRKHQLSFRTLLNEQRKRDSIRLLKDATLSQEEVASRIGYSAPANFIRAFRNWTGMTPGEYRQTQIRAGKLPSQAATVIA